MNKDVNWRNAGIGLVGLLIVGTVVLGVFHEIGQAPWQFITALIALFSALITVSLNLQIQIRNEQRPKKVEIYEEVIHFFFEILFAERLGHPQKSEEEIINFYADITPKMILWASDDVLDRFIQFRQIDPKKSSENPKIAIQHLGEMLLDIRKDLGHGNKNLNETKIFGTFVVDVEHLK